MAEVHSLSELNTLFTLDSKKLAGIEAEATADQTAAEILASLLTVDGLDSGLDTDLWRGQTPAQILASNFITSNLSNLAIGNTGLIDITTGANNVALGNLSLAAVTSGYSNVAVGASTLESNTSGINNTAIGNNALNDNISGTRNTGVGASTLSLTTGSNNTAVGFASGSSITTGSGNITLGHYVGSTISYGPVFNVTTEDNRVVMGHTGVTNAYVQVPWTVVSDKRDKTEFKKVPYGLDFVDSLSPTSFKFRESRETEDTSGRERYGFLAQDILALEGDNPVIIDTEDLENLKFNESDLIPVLVNAIKELSEKVKALEKE